MSPEWGCGVRVTRAFSFEQACQELSEAVRVCTCWFVVEELLGCFGVSVYVWTLQPTDQVNPQGLPPSPHPLTRLERAVQVVAKSGPRQSRLTSWRRLCPRERWSLNAKHQSSHHGASRQPPI